jgi:Phycobilisome protein
MNPQFSALFEEGENRYLASNELGFISTYVSSLPDRLEAYRSLRDQEMDILQTVANHLAAELAQVPQADLERSLKSAVLLLRSCAMAMLVDDPEIVKERFLAWAKPLSETYNLHAIDAVVYRLLIQRLTQVLGAKPMALLNPFLAIANAAIPTPIPSSFTPPAAVEDESVNGIAIGW